MDDNVNDESKKKAFQKQSEERLNNNNERVDEDDYSGECDLPLGIFVVNIDDEALKKMEESAILFTEDESELAEYNVQKVIKELNKE